MSYEIRQAEAVRDKEYDLLEKRTGQLTDEVELWVSRATTLHMNSLTTEEQADIIEMRDQFILDLKTILGV